jgi:hypothetical protein
MNSTASNNSQGKTAWVQLYEARSRTAELNVRAPGRPPAPIPRRKIGLTLSQGEIHELATWQEQLSNVMRRKVSTGETVGILVRVCTGRLSRLSITSSARNLTELVEAMIGEE